MQLLVHRLNIPGLSGNEGLSKNKRTQTVAEYVEKKIRYNAMPPTVSTEGLNTVGVLK
jgi:hypothetical protein